MREKSAFCLFLYLALLLGGCTSLDKRQTYTIPESRKLEIRHLLANRSGRLEMLFMEQARYIEDSARYTVESVVDVEELGSEEIVLNVLLTTNSEELLPDEAFERVYDVAGIRDIEISSAYAVALAKYLTDERYQCKRPLYYQYFKDRYGDKSKDVFCHHEVPFNITSNLNDGHVLWLNPERVSSVHILFAGSGDGMISKFGHISMRLIICPEDNYSAAACDSNIYEHLVMGYRAHIDEFKIDTFEGIWGGYRAYLFANRFMDVYQEYAIGEFREVYSLPLKLSKAEIMNRVRAMSDIHWGYTGEYKFLTNNCSVLTQKLLMHMWSDFAHDSNLSELFWRPDLFFSELRVSPLSDFKKLDNLNSAEQDGYYFSSTRPIYQEALNLVRDTMTSPEFGDLDEYMSINPVRRMKQVIQDEKYLDAITVDTRLLNAQILLEELSVIKFERSMIAEMAYFFDQNDILKIHKIMRHGLNETEYLVFSNCILNPVLELIKPIKRKDGIPGITSVDPDQNRASTCETDESKVYIRRAAEEMKKMDPENWAPVEAAIHYWITSIKNVETLTAMESRQYSKARLH